MRDVGFDFDHTAFDSSYLNLTLTINISYFNYTFQFLFGCLRDPEFVPKAYTALHFLLNVTGMNFRRFVLSIGWMIMTGSIKDQIEYIKLCCQLIFRLF